MDCVKVINSSWRVYSKIDCSTKRFVKGDNTLIKISIRYPSSKKKKKNLHVDIRNVLIGLSSFQYQIQALK